MYSFKKLKKNDFKKFKKLFAKCFQKKISRSFFNWRYFKEKKSFCYGLFYNSNLIGNVGMVSKKLNNSGKSNLFSRHSSMILKKYRNKGLYSILLKKLKKNFLHNIDLVVAWPNQLNYSNFSMNYKNTIFKKYNIYKVISNSNNNKQVNLLNIEYLNSIKKREFINSNSFFFKDYDYYKFRYLDYKKKCYFLHKFILGKNKSFFILKKIANNDYVLLDFLGPIKIFDDHFNFLLKNNLNLILNFSKRIKNSNYKYLGDLNFKIILINMKKNKIKPMLQKNIMLGDTDTFIDLF